jgi:GT2 family glycosyltransferase
MKKTKLTIVICTKNINALFKTCFHSLNKQSNFQILIVNNSGKKLDYIKGATVVVQPQLGHSFARNKGWQEAIGEYIAYIDDDAIASKDWVKQILNFIRIHPGVSAFGGQHSRHSNIPLPKWMPDNYGRKDCGTAVRRLTIGKDFLNGTNMIFKRSIFQKIGGFNQKYGNIGNKTFYGEETELQLRLARAGIAVWYDPKITVSHLVANSKMNIGWIIKEAFITGQATFQMMDEYKDIFKTANQGRKLKLDISGNVWQKLVRLIQLTAYLAGWHYQKIS